MIRFVVKPHSEQPERQVVEVFRDDQFIATVTGVECGQAVGINVNSKHAPNPMTTERNMVATVVLNLDHDLTKGR